MHVKASLVLLVIAGCSHPGPARPRKLHTTATRVDAPASPAAPAVPGMRLPAGAIPLHYDLRLELDPDRETFSGHVAIRVQLDAPTDRVWLHVADLELSSATFRTPARDGTLGLVASAERDDHMRAFSFGAPLPAGEVTLAFDYTGLTTRDDDEGLFRQQADGRWFLYSQAESMFARRMLPCFDEPRFKPAWRVTLVVPAGQVALGNGGLVAETVLGDGRHEVQLAEVAGMPSYLLAVAVGPFTVIDAGRVGRNHVPVRVAVPAGDARHATIAAGKLPAIVDALERYTDRPLPLAKLDLVAVPRFFGAMENVGLVTFESSILVGDIAAPSMGKRFIRFAAHELAHQWFGNLVTPAWWDDLWLAEGFATWLGDKVSTQLGGFDDPVLRTQLARLEALAADDADDARPLRRAITSTEDADDRFDAISYEKGGAVLGMFESFVGAEAFRVAIRSYLRDHAGGSATSNDFVAALGAASSPAVAKAFTSYLDRAGAPIVEITASCASAPALELHARDGATVPVCVRHAAGRSCVVAGDRERIPLAACPSWVAGNAGGDGYYRVATTLESASPLTPGEQLAHTDDLAAALLRHELALQAALHELRALAETRDANAQLAALAIADAIDPLVADATRPAWTAWLTARFASRLGKIAMLSPRTPTEIELRDRLAELLPASHPDPAVIAAATALVDRALRGSTRPPPDFALALVAPRSGRPLFDRIVAVAAASSAERGDAWFETLGAFGPDLAPVLVKLVTDGRFRAARIWPAVASMLARPETRTAAWHAVYDHIGQVLAQLAQVELPAVLEATRGLCDRVARDQVAAAFAGKLDEATRTQALVPALAAIDRCIARRATLGDLAAALR